MEKFLLQEIVTFQNQVIYLIISTKVLRFKELSLVQKKVWENKTLNLEVKIKVEKKIT